MVIQFFKLVKNDLLCEIFCTYEISGGINSGINIFCYSTIDFELNFLIEFFERTFLQCNEVVIRIFRFCNQPTSLKLFYYKYKESINVSTINSIAFIMKSKQTRYISQKESTMDLKTVKFSIKQREPLYIYAEIAIKVVI